MELCLILDGANLEFLRDVLPPAPPAVVKKGCSREEGRERGGGGAAAIEYAGAAKQTFPIERKLYSRN